MDKTELRKWVTDEMEWLGEKFSAEYLNESNIYQMRAAVLALLDENEAITKERDALRAHSKTFTL